MPNKKRSLRHGVAKFPELEVELIGWIKAKQQQVIAVSTMLICLKAKCWAKRSRNKFQGISRLVPKIYELNIRQNSFSDFSSPRLGVRLMRGGVLYVGFYGN